MRNLGIAIVASGLLVGMTAAATAQNIASAVPAPKQEFVVFADKGSNTLSPTAASVVRTAVSEASSAQQVTLVGRADNIAAVKGELVRQGVSPQAIVMKTEARAPISRSIGGLSDPIDRRVEIKFQ